MPSRRLLPALFLGLAFAALLAACGGGSKQGSLNLVSPTGESKASPTAAPSTTAAPGGLTPGFLYRALGETEDTIWLVKADYSRQAVTTIPHAMNYGSWPSLSPDGRFLAYTAFAGGLEPRQDSQLWLLELSTGQRQQLADHVQLQGAPLWAPDGSAVIVVRQQANATQLLQVSLAGSAPKSQEVVLSAPTSDILGLLPLGYAADAKTFYVLRIPVASPGSDIAAINVADGSTISSFRIGPSSVIDPTLSPDRSKISWSGIGCAGVCVRDFASGATLTLTAPALGSPPYFRPAWTSDSARLAIGHQPASAGGAGPIILTPATNSASPLAGPEEGFDAPMGWSADGRLLFVHSTTARTTGQAGQTRIVAIETANGQRHEIAVTTSLVDVVSIGWLSAR